MKTLLTSSLIRTSSLNLSLKLGQPFLHTSLPKYSEFSTINTFRLHDTDLIKVTRPIYRLNLALVFLFLGKEFSFQGIKVQGSTK